MCFKKATLITRITQAATFYQLLKSDPNQLIEAAKTLLARALTDAILPPNSQAAQELRQESVKVQQQVNWHFDLI